MTCWKMKVSLVSFARAMLLWLLCWGTHPSIASPDALFEWLKGKPNGFFSDKISWKQIDPDDPASAYAMFAEQDISENERLIVVPHSALITSNGSGFNCDTVKMLVAEVEKGKDSEYFPYIDYLFSDDEKRRRVPTSWSKEGQRLLKSIIGGGLFPTSIDHHSVQDNCPEITNPSQLQEDAYIFVISRSWDDVMIPGKIHVTIVLRRVVSRCHYCMLNVVSIPLFLFTA
jgi:hypothetical protein